MKYDVDRILSDLSWSNSEETQKHGMDWATKINDLSVLIMPKGNKSVWENCAKVLATKNDEELLPYLSDLFVWLKDMNWPGAYVIYDRLIDVSSNAFLPACEYNLFVAKQTQDHVWEIVIKDLLVEYVFQMIDCRMPPEIQLEGIRIGKIIETIKPLIQPQTPKYNKNVWDNCAVIISTKGDEILKPFLVDLLEWLRDMEWPGAPCILRRLKKYSDVESLQNAVQVCILKDRCNNEDNWRSILHSLLKKG